LVTNIAQHNPLLIDNRNFSGIDYCREPFPVGEYERCTFSNCTLTNADLSQAVFSNCEFRNCDLSLAKVVNTALRTVRFTDCKLLGLRFENCNNFLLALEFENCNLDLASFFKLQIRKTIFRNCRLHEADLGEADLSQSIFDFCDLAGATFSHTVLDGADFTTAVNFSIDPENNRLKKARFSAAGLAGLLDKYNLEIED